MRITTIKTKTVVIIINTPKWRDDNIKVETKDVGMMV
jgi:hypothetical protein